jgi:hypothetical protein
MQLLIMEIEDVKDDQCDSASYSTKILFDETGKHSSIEILIF